MKTTTKLFGIVALFATVLFASCKKEETVTANPVASFTIAPNDTIYSNETIEFTNTSTDADSYVWSFGLGDNSTLTNPTKYYGGIEPSACEVDYTVTLTATKNGKSSTATKNIHVIYCS
jgi:PKD repeat protein